MLYTSLILSLFVASARAGHDSWSCTGPWPEMGDGSIGEFCVVGMGTSPLVLNFPSATATDGIVGVTVLGAAGPDGVPKLACLAGKGGYPDMITDIVAMGPSFESCSPTLDLNELTNFWSRSKDDDGNWLGKDTEITDYNDFAATIKLDTPAVMDCPRTGGPTCPTGVTCPDGFETRGGTKEGLYTFLRNTFGLEDAEQMAKDECCTQRRSRKLLFGTFSSNDDDHNDDDDHCTQWDCTGM